MKNNTVGGPGAAPCWVLDRGPHRSRFPATTTSSSRQAKNAPEAAVLLGLPGEKP
jgi:hypothetical protein